MLQGMALAGNLPVTGYRKVRRIPVQREVSGELLGSAAGRVTVSIGTPGNGDRVFGPLQLLDMPARGWHSLAFPIIHLGDVIQVVVIDEQIIRPAHAAFIADVSNNGFVFAIAVNIRVGALWRIVLIPLQASHRIGVAGLQAFRQEAAF